MFHVAISFGLIAAQLVCVESQLTAAVVTPIIETAGCTIEREDPDNRACDNDAFPWIVSIYNRINPRFIRRCSGSVISLRHVLTTAWCMMTEVESEEDRLQVYIDAREDLPRIDVCSAYLHPEFHYRQDHLQRIVHIQNNIAILSLAKDFPVAYLPKCPQKFLCLAQDRHDELSKANSSTATWGYRRNEAVSNPRLTKPLVMVSKILTAVQCPSSAAPEYFCTHLPGRATFCYGDDGAAVISNMNDRYYQLGIVSWIFYPGHCNQINHRIINVTYHAQFIKDVVAHKGPCGQIIDTIHNHSYPETKGIAIH